MKQEKFTPSSSLVATIGNLFRGRIHVFRKDVGKVFRIPDSQKYTVFRHLIVDSANNQLETNRAVFRVRFKLANMSPGFNKLFSWFPIPFFIGLPGFEEKYWLVNELEGYFQGIYQWASKEYAEKYATSWPMKFMTKRAVPGSISHEIISHTTLSEYLETTN